MGMKPLTPERRAGHPDVRRVHLRRAINAAPVSALVPADRPAQPQPDDRAGLGGVRRAPARVEPDQVPQGTLDAILWHSVYGADSTPPPPGPGANRGE